MRGSGWPGQLERFLLGASLCRLVPSASAAHYLCPSLFAILLLLVVYAVLAPRLATRLPAGGSAAL